MIYWGINALNHGSSLSVLSHGQLLMHEACAGDQLDADLLFRAFNHGGPNQIFWYERPWLKKIRQLTAGQFDRAIDMSVLPSRYLAKIAINYAGITYTPHHGSHAAAGYYTSPFDDCAVVVLDAIGEFECASIWQARGQKLKKVWTRNYPHSLGLFYSAFTDLLGLEPIKQEGVLQAMSLKGDAGRYLQDVQQYFSGPMMLNYNFHRGVRNWPHAIEHDQDRWDIAAAVQAVFEQQIQAVNVIAKNLVGSGNLVYMGGCAFNSKANTLIQDQWDGIWSLPDPGDASSSLGAVLYHTQQRIHWTKGVAKHITIKV